MTKKEFAEYNYIKAMPRDWIGQGYGYKAEWDPAKPDDIIYIPESAYFEFDGVTAQDGYSMNDFVKLTNGNVEKAKELFEYIDWQYPDSALDEVMTDEEREAKETKRMERIREENKKIAEAIIGYCGMGVAAELPYEDHVESLTKELEKCSDRLRGWLSMIAEGKYLKETFSQLEPLPNETKPDEDGVDVNKKTAYGTKYGDIARWITMFLSQGTFIYDFDDQTFYYLISKELEETKSQTLLYYLSDAVENTAQM